jgi:hypothetical protein
MTDESERYTQPSLELGQGSITLELAGYWHDEAWRCGTMDDARGHRT